MANKYVANDLLNSDGNCYLQSLTNVIKFISTEL